MVKRGFLVKHKIVRNAMREDLLGFGLPALVVFVVGLVVSARDGYDGLVGAIWDLITQRRSVSLLAPQEIVGLALFVVGLTTSLIAVFTLKRFYSSALVIREDHQLITHGLYRFARHPIYLGAFTMCIGVPVYAASLYGLLVMLVLVPIVLYRIRIEERLLTEEFGDAYRAYKQATRKLIPFVY